MYISPTLHYHIFYVLAGCRLFQHLRATTSNQEPRLFHMSMLNLSFFFSKTGETMSLEPEAKPETDVTRPSLLC